MEAVAGLEPAILDLSVSEYGPQALDRVSPGWFFE